MAVTAVGLVLAGSAVAGCSKGSEKFNTVGDAIDSSSAEKGASSTGAAGGAEARGQAALPAGPAAGAQVAEDRDVIYTGSLTVQVDDAPAAADDARKAAEDAGGYLASQEADLEGTKEVRVTVRVPAEAFDQTMADLGELGTVHGRKIGSKDVTDEVVDLQGRLENAQTSAQRLRELLAKAENVQNVITIEDRLTQRETEIEAITGQLEVVQDQVALATIRATLTEKDQASVNDDLPGPLEALRSGGVAFVNVVLLAVVVLAYSLPFLVVGALVLWPLWRRRAARRRARTDGRSSHPEHEGAEVF